MNSDSLNMVSRLGEGHMPCTFFLSEPQLKTEVPNTNWHPQSSFYVTGGTPSFKFLTQAL